MWNRTAINYQVNSTPDGGGKSSRRVSFWGWAWWASLTPLTPQPFLWGKRLLPRHPYRTIIARQTPARGPESEIASRTHYRPLRTSEYDSFTQVRYTDLKKEKTRCPRNARIINLNANSLTRPPKGSSALPTGNAADKTVEEHVHKKKVGKGFVRNVANSLYGLGSNLTRRANHSICKAGEGRPSQGGLIGKLRTAESYRA